MLSHSFGPRSGASLSFVLSALIVLGVLAASASAMHCWPGEVLTYRARRIHGAVGHPESAVHETTIAEILCERRREDYADIRVTLRPDPHNPMEGHGIDTARLEPFERAITFGAAWHVNGSMTDWRPASAADAGRRDADHLSLRDACVAWLQEFHVDFDSLPMNSSLLHRAATTTTKLHNSTHFARAVRPPGDVIVESHKYAEIGSPNGIMAAMTHATLIGRKFTKEPRPANAHIVAPPSIVLQKEHSRPISLANVAVRPIDGAPSDANATLSAKCGPWSAEATGTVEELNHKGIANAFSRISPSCSAITLTLRFHSGDHHSWSIPIVRPDVAAATASMTSISLTGYERQHHCQAQVEEVFGRDVSIDEAYDMVVTEIETAEDIMQPSEYRYADSGLNTSVPVLLRAAHLFDCHPHLAERYAADTMHRPFALFQERFGYGPEEAEWQCKRSVEVLAAMTRAKEAEALFTPCMESAGRCCPITRHHMVDQLAGRDVPLRSTTLVKHIVDFATNSEMGEVVAMAVYNWAVPRATKVANVGEVFVKYSEDFMTATDDGHERAEAVGGAPTFDTVAFPSNRSVAAAKSDAKETRRTFKAQDDSKTELTLSQAFIEGVFDEHLRLPEKPIENGDLMGSAFLGLAWYYGIRNEVKLKLGAAGAIFSQIDAHDHAGVSVYFFGATCIPFKAEIKYLKQLSFDLVTFLLSQTCRKGSSATKSKQPTTRGRRNAITEPPPGYGKKAAAAAQRGFEAEGEADPPTRKRAKAVDPSARPPPTRTPDTAESESGPSEPSSPSWGSVAPLAFLFRWPSDIPDPRLRAVDPEDGSNTPPPFDDGLHSPWQPSPDLPFSKRRGFIRTSPAKVKVHPLAHTGRTLQGVEEAGQVALCRKSTEGCAVFPCAAQALNCSNASTYVDKTGEEVCNVAASQSPDDDILDAFYSSAALCFRNTLLDSTVTLQGNCSALQHYSVDDQADCLIKSGICVLEKPVRGRLFTALNPPEHVYKTFINAGPAAFAAATRAFDATYEGSCVGPDHLSAFHDHNEMFIMEFALAGVVDMRAHVESWAQTRDAYITYYVGYGTTPPPNPGTAPGPGTNTWARVIVSVRKDQHLPMRRSLQRLGGNPIVPGVHIFSWTECYQTSCKCLAGAGEWMKVLALANNPDDNSGHTEAPIGYTPSPDPEFLDSPLQRCFAQYAYDSAECNINPFVAMGKLELCLGQDIVNSSIPGFNAYPSSTKVWERLRTYAMVTIPNNAVNGRNTTDCAAFRACRKANGVTKCGSEAAGCFFPGSAFFTSLKDVASEVVGFLFDAAVEPGDDWAPCVAEYNVCSDKNATEGGDCNNKLWGCIMGPLNQYSSKGQCAALDITSGFGDYVSALSVIVSKYYVSRLRWGMSLYDTVKFVTKCRCEESATGVYSDALPDNGARVTIFNVNHDFSLNASNLKGKKKKDAVQKKPPKGRGCLGSNPLDIPKSPPFGYGIILQFQLQAFYDRGFDFSFALQEPKDFSSAQLNGLKIVPKVTFYFLVGFHYSVYGGVGILFKIYGVVANATAGVELFGTVTGLKFDIGLQITGTFAGQPVLPMKWKTDLLYSYVIAGFTAALRIKVCVYVFLFGGCISSPPYVLTEFPGWGDNGTIWSSEKPSPEPALPLVSEVELLGKDTKAPLQYYVRGSMMVCRIPQEPVADCPLDTFQVKLEGWKGEHKFDFPLVDVVGPDRAMTFSLIARGPPPDNSTTYEGYTLQCVVQVSACKTKKIVEKRSILHIFSEALPQIWLQRGANLGFDRPYSFSAKRRCFNFNAAISIAGIAYSNTSLIDARSGFGMPNTHRRNSFVKRLFCYSTPVPSLRLLLDVVTGSQQVAGLVSADAQLDLVPIRFVNVSIGCTPEEQSSRQLTSSTGVCIKARFVPGRSGIAPVKTAIVRNDKGVKVEGVNVVTQGAQPMSTKLESVTADGWYTLTLLAIRGAGKVDASPALQFSIDHQPPQPGHAVHVDPATSAPLRRAISGAGGICVLWSGFHDRISGLANVTWEFQCNGEATPQFNVLWEPTPTAVKRLCQNATITGLELCRSTLNATDKAGNRRTEHVEIRVDQTPPDLNVTVGCDDRTRNTAPGGGVYWSQSKFVCVTVAAMDLQSEVANVTVVLQDSTGAALQTTERINVGRVTSDAPTLFLGPFPDGEYTVNATALNYALLHRNASAVVVVDTKPPTGGSVVLNSDNTGIPLAAGTTTFSVPASVTSFGCDGNECPQQWLQCVHPHGTGASWTVTVPKTAGTHSVSVPVTGLGAVQCRLGAVTAAGRAARAASNIVFGDDTPPIAGSPITVVKTDAALYVYNGAPRRPAATTAINATAITEIRDAVRARVERTKLRAMNGRSGGHRMLLAVPTAIRAKVAAAGGSATVPASCADAAAQLSAPTGGLSPAQIALRLPNSDSDSATTACWNLGTAAAPVFAASVFSLTAGWAAATPQAGVTRVGRLILADAQGRVVRTKECGGATITAMASAGTRCALALDPNAPLPSGLASLDRSGAAAYIEFRYAGAGSAFQGTPAVVVTQGSRVISMPQALPTGESLNIFATTAAPPTASAAMKDPESGALGLTCEAAVGTASSTESCAAFTALPEGGRFATFSSRSAQCRTDAQLIATVRCRNAVLPSWTTQTVSFSDANTNAWITAVTVAPYVTPLTEATVSWTSAAAASEAARCSVCLGEQPFETDVYCSPSVWCNATTVALGKAPLPETALQDGVEYFATVFAAAPGRPRTLAASAGFIAVGRPVPNATACSVDCCPTNADDDAVSEILLCTADCRDSAATAATNATIVTADGTILMPTATVDSVIITTLNATEALANGTDLSLRETAFDNTATAPMLRRAKYPLAVSPQGVPLIGVPALAPTPDSVTATLPASWRYPFSTAATVVVTCRGGFTVGSADWDAVADTVDIALNWTSLPDTAWPVRESCQVVATFVGRCGDTLDSPPAPFAVARRPLLYGACGSAFYTLTNGGQYCFDTTQPKSSEPLAAVELRSNGDTGTCIVASTANSSRVFTVYAEDDRGFASTCEFVARDALGPQLGSLGFGRVPTGQAPNATADRQLWWADPNEVCLFFEDAFPGVSPWTSADYAVDVSPIEISPAPARDAAPPATAVTAAFAPEGSGALGRGHCFPLPPGVEVGSTGAYIYVYISARDGVGREDRVVGHVEAKWVGEPDAPDEAALRLQNPDVIELDLGEFVVSVPPGVGATEAGDGHEVCVLVPRWDSGAFNATPCRTEAFAGKFADDDTDAVADAVWSPTDPYDASYDRVCITVPWTTGAASLHTRLVCRGYPGPVLSTGIRVDTAVPTVTAVLHGGKKAALRQLPSVCADVRARDPGLGLGLSTVNVTLFIDAAPNAAVSGIVEVETRGFNVTDGSPRFSSSACFNLSVMPALLGGTADSEQQTAPWGQFFVVATAVDVADRRAQATSNRVTSVPRPVGAMDTPPDPTTQAPTPSPASPPNITVGDNSTIILRTAAGFTVNVTAPFPEYGLLSATWCVTEMTIESEPCDTVSAQPFDFAADGTAVLPVGAFSAQFSEGPVFGVSYRWLDDSGAEFRVAVAARFRVMPLLLGRPSRVTLGPVCGGRSDGTAVRWGAGKALQVCWASIYVGEKTAEWYDITLAYAGATVPTKNVTRKVIAPHNWATTELGPEFFESIHGDNVEVCVMGAETETGPRGEATCASLVVVAKPPPKPLAGDGPTPCRDITMTSLGASIGVSWCKGAEVTEYGISNYSATCYVSRPGAATADVLGPVFRGPTFRPVVLFDTQENPYPNGTRGFCTVCATGAFGAEACTRTDGFSIVPEQDVPTADAANGLSVNTPTGGEVQLCSTDTPPRCTGAGTHHVWSPASGTSTTTAVVRYTPCARAGLQKVCLLVFAPTASTLDVGEALYKRCVDASTSGAQHSHRFEGVPLSDGCHVRSELRCSVSQFSPSRTVAITAAVELIPPTFADSALPAMAPQPPTTSMCLPVAFAMAATASPVTSGTCNVCGSSVALSVGLRRITFPLAAPHFAGVSAAALTSHVSQAVEATNATVVAAWHTPVGAVEAYISGGNTSLAAAAPRATVVAKGISACCFPVAGCSVAELGQASNSNAAVTAANEAQLSSTAAAASFRLLPSANGPRPVNAGDAATPVTVSVSTRGLFVCAPAHRAAGGAPVTYSFAASSATQTFPARHGQTNRCAYYAVSKRQQTILSGAAVVFAAAAVDITGRYRTVPSQNVSLVFSRSDVMVETLPSSRRAENVTCTVQISSEAKPLGVWLRAVATTSVDSAIPAAASLSEWRSVEVTSVEFGFYDGAATFTLADIDAPATATVVRCLARMSFSHTAGVALATEYVGGAAPFAPRPALFVFDPPVPTLVTAGAPFKTFVVALDARGAPVRVPEAAVTVDPLDVDYPLAVSATSAPSFDGDGRCAVTITAWANASFNIYDGAGSGSTAASGSDAGTDEVPTFALDVLVTDRMLDDVLASFASSNWTAVEALAPPTTVTLTPNPTFGLVASAVQNVAFTSTRLEDGLVATSDNTTVVTVKCPADECKADSQSGTASSGVAAVGFVPLPRNASRSITLDVSIRSGGSPKETVLPLSVTIPAAATVAWAINGTDEQWAVAAPVSFPQSGLTGVSGLELSAEASTSEGTSLGSITAELDGGNVSIAVASVLSAAVSIQPSAPGKMFDPAAAKVTLTDIRKVPVAVVFGRTFGPDVSDPTAGSVSAFAATPAAFSVALPFTVLCSDVTAAAPDARVNAAQTPCDVPVGVTGTAANVAVQYDAATAARAVTLTPSAAGQISSPCALLAATSSIGTPLTVTCDVSAPWLVTAPLASLCEDGQDELALPLSVSVPSGGTLTTTVHLCDARGTPIAATLPAVVLGSATTNVSVAPQASHGAYTVSIDGSTTAPLWGSGVEVSFTLRAGSVTRTVSAFRRAAAAVRSPRDLTAPLNTPREFDASVVDASGASLPLPADGVQVASVLSNCTVSLAPGSSANARAHGTLRLQTVASAAGHRHCDASLTVGDAPAVAFSVPVVAVDPDAAATITAKPTTAVAGVVLTVRVCLSTLAGRRIMLRSADIGANVSVSFPALMGTPTATAAADGCVDLSGTPRPSAALGTAPLPLSVTMPQGEALLVSVTPQWTVVDAVAALAQSATAVSVAESVTIRATPTNAAGAAVVLPPGTQWRVVDAEGTAIASTAAVAQDATGSVDLTVQASARQADVAARGIVRTALCADIPALPDVVAGCVPDVVIFATAGALALNTSTFVPVALADRPVRFGILFGAAQGGTVCSVLSGTCGAGCTGDVSFNVDASGTCFATAASTGGNGDFTSVSVTADLGPTVTATITTTFCRISVGWGETAVFGKWRPLLVSVPWGTGGSATCPAVEFEVRTRAAAADMSAAVKQSALGYVVGDTSIAVDLYVRRPSENTAMHLWSDTPAAVADPGTPAPPSTPAPTPAPTTPSPATPSPTPSPAATPAPGATPGPAKTPRPALPPSSNSQASSSSGSAPKTTNSPMANSGRTSSFASGSAAKSNPAAKSSSSATNLGSPANTSSSETDDGSKSARGSFNDASSSPLALAVALIAAVLTYAL